MLTGANSGDTVMYSQREKPFNVVFKRSLSANDVNSITLGKQAPFEREIRKRHVEKQR